MQASWFVSAALAGVMMMSGAAASEYPVKPITLIVPFSAGGNNDVSGRIVAQKLGALLGQTVVVENRTGAGGAIGAAAVANAAPDGYTLGFLSSGPMAANVSLYKKLPYDPVKGFAPIARVSTSPSVLVVNPSLGVTDVKQLIARAKEKPGSLNYGTAGIGSSSHLSGALFANLAGVEMTPVAYRGGAPALADLLGARVQVVISPILEVMPQVRAGQLKALGVTSLKRSALLPEIPAIAEILPGYEVLTWNGVVAPAGTPPAIIEKLHKAMQAALADKDVIARLEELGLETAIASPDEFSAYIRQQIDAFAKLAKIANVQPQ
jgi:tripartite-type tricarboxylate transporter receptor subunit TctC